MSQPDDHICKKNPADYRTKMVATSVECSSYNLLNPIRSGRGGGGGERGFKSPPLRFFALTYLILELHYCALVTFPKK